MPNVAVCAQVRYKHGSHSSWASAYLAEDGSNLVVERSLDDQLAFHVTDHLAESRIPRPALPVTEGISDPPIVVVPFPFGRGSNRSLTVAANVALGWSATRGNAMLSRENSSATLIARRFAPRIGVAHRASAKPSLSARIAALPCARKTTGNRGILTLSTLLTLPESPNRYLAGDKVWPHFGEQNGYRKLPG